MTSRESVSAPELIPHKMQVRTILIFWNIAMEEIFTERDEFKKLILASIALELSQFGLKIYNANIKELRDAPGSNYFGSLSKKAHEGAINQARVDVASAQAMGSVGEAKKVGEQERELAKIQAETQVSKYAKASSEKNIVLLFLENSAN